MVCRPKKISVYLSPKPLQCPPRSSLIKSLSTSQLNPNIQYPAPFLHVRIWVITKTPEKYVM